jgi:hypothetical protein
MKTEHASLPDAIHPRSQLRAEWLWRVVGGGALAVFVLRLTYFLFQDLADGRAGHVAERVFNEATGSLLAVVPIGGTFLLARRVPLVRPLRRGAIAIYAAAFLAFSLLHTTAMIAGRAALAPAFGLLGYHYAFTAARFAYEMANDVVFFVATIALLALTESLLAQRERERHAAALERSLLRAELSNLRLQLQPHFLFNALNTISSTMYDDVEAADTLLGQLADLLRTSLRTSSAHEVPVRDELHLLAQYVALMQARFGDALDVQVDAAPDVGDLLVPSMVLQPLVENAVRHGGVTRLGHGRVRIVVRRVASDAGPALELRVEDAPSAFAGTLPVEDGAGTGLATTARRLRLLYGGAQAMHAGATPDGGFAVTLRIPVRTRAAAPEAGVPDAVVERVPASR